MRTKTGILACCTALAIAVAASGSGIRSPVAVSPGAADHVSEVESACPTFSWSAVEGAQSYELLIYPYSEEAENAAPAHHWTLPGAATTWTPALAECLRRGWRYGWAVRALAAGQEGPWSRALFFAVAPGPQVQEVAEVVEIVRRQLAGSSETGAVGRDSSGPAGSALSRPQLVATTETADSLPGGAAARSQPGSAGSAATGAIVAEGKPVLTAASPVIVPAAAFTSDGISSGGFLFNLGRVEGLAAEGDDCLKAPVDLPTGVTLVELAAVIIDNDPDRRIDLNLWRFDQTDTTGGVDTSTTSIAVLHSEVGSPSDEPEELSESINSGSGVLVAGHHAFYLTTCLYTDEIGLYWVSLSFVWP